MAQDEPAAAPPGGSDPFGAPSLVIFDFDGVVADSEIISLTSLRDVLEKFGIAGSEEDVRHRYLGASLATIAADVAARSPHGPAEGFEAAWHSVLYDRFRAELAPVQGLPALLDRLDARGLPYCIASSGTFERISVALGAMDLTHRFPHVFSAEMVVRGKPAPDLFLYAAAAMGVAPRDCLVIEDSPFGIMAAKAAGIRSVGFTGGAHLAGIRAEHGRKLAETGASAVIDALDALSV
ncbi:HAD family hydrolase [Oceaniglobus roseus]|uniref:HAD family hydrolase n=1 Tax=Oceaniglobus roseus TaxID=1737570 RepID=UPI000C7EE1A8|nr:HAD family phosphatase [Kandeliimicrobium roseum]